MDNFWFTVMHEVSHIKNGDALSVDRDLTGEDSGEPILIHDEAESRASEEAAHSLIPREEIESFIRRVGPLYSKDRIIQFAHRIKIHPGIVVGQLQTRKEIGWGTNKEMLVKIRAVVVETSLTDGWGRTVTPGLL
jgi:HTH-type transcriptional regulator/antitoxin HigA